MSQLCAWYCKLNNLGTARQMRPFLLKGRTVPAEATQLAPSFRAGFAHPALSRSVWEDRVDPSEEGSAPLGQMPLLSVELSPHYPEAFLDL